MAESMKDYEHELAASLHRFEEGDIVTGTVIGISDDAVTLDLDSYAPGIVRGEEMSNDPHFSAAEHFSYGQRVRAKVIKTDDGKGNLALSFKEAEDELSWKHLTERMERHEIFTVRIREAVRGGVVTYVEGLRAFIPASQISVAYVEDLKAMEGRELAVIVTEVDKGKNRVVLSGKAVDQERIQAEREHKVNSLIPGDIVTGKVESIMPYGAFVALGDGVSGLVHISQIATKRLKTVEEALSVGDEVRAKILNIKDGKVSLSIRAVEEDEAPAREAQEAKQRSQEIEQFADHEEASTSLGDLLKGIQLS